MFFLPADFFTDKRLRGLEKHNESCCHTALPALDLRSKPQDYQNKEECLLRCTPELTSNLQCTFS